MKRTMNRKNNLLITHCFLVSTGTWLRKGWYSPQPRSITPRENDGLLITPLLSCPWTVSYCSMQARIQGRWNGWIFTPLFWAPFFLFADAQTSNTSTRLWFYYIITKIHPPFQNSGSAHAMMEFYLQLCVLATSRL